MSPPSLRSGRHSREKPPRQHGRRRWILLTVVAVIVLAAGAVVASVKLQPSLPPLALPGNAAAPPAGQLAGTWSTSTGSEAGFRVRESTLGLGNDVTGRTSAVSGVVVVTSAQLVSATFRIDLGEIVVNGKTRQPQLIQSLGVTAHPVATVTLVHAAPLSSAFSSGATITRAVAGTLTLDGTTRPVTVTLSARRDGNAIDAAGSLPVTFADFGITKPHDYGAFGSLADNGTAEFLLILKAA